MAEKSRDFMKELSAGMSQAVKQGEKYTVMVDGNRGYPSSGVLYRPDLVITAEHALERNEDIRIGLPDGTVQSGNVRGRDSLRDLAVVEMSAKAPDTVESASQAPEVGQLVLALGRPTDEGIQASLGVIGIVDGSYRSRRGNIIQGVMRSDAVRFPGFAGGPLVDTDGKVAGINVLGNGLGASITIPAEAAWEIAERLLKEGNIRQGYLGIRSQRVVLSESLGRSQQTGLLIVGIEEGSPSESAGLMVGDILVEFHGKAITEHDELLQELAVDLAGKNVKASVFRGGQLTEITIKVGSLDDREHRHHRGHHGHSRRWCG